MYLALIRLIFVLWALYRNFFPVLFFGMVIVFWGGLGGFGGLGGSEEDDDGSCCMAYSNNIN